MDIEQLKDDVRPERITPDRLVELVVTVPGELQAAKREADQARRRIEELERQLRTSPTPKVSEPFSMRAEEQRQEARGK
jgi:transposase